MRFLSRWGRSAVGACDRPRAVGLLWLVVHTRGRALHRQMVQVHPGGWYGRRRL